MTDKTYKALFVKRATHTFVAGSAKLAEKTIDEFINYLMYLYETNEKRNRDKV